MLGGSSQGWESTGWVRNCSRRLARLYYVEGREDIFCDRLSKQCPDLVCNRCIDIVQMVMEMLMQLQAVMMRVNIHRILYLVSSLSQLAVVQ